MVKTSKENRLKKEIIDVSRRCGTQGWCPGTLGNISVLSPDSGAVYIKRSGADLGRLELGDILTLNSDKGAVMEGKGKPSVETGLHLGIYNVRKDARAIFHVHPPFATAFAVAGRKIPMVTEASRIVLRDVPLLPKSPPGSARLAMTVKQGFKDPRVKAVLLKEHGVVSIGETLEKAYHICSLVEDTAKMALLSSLITHSI